MGSEYRIELLQDSLTSTPNGTAVHHPLSGPYRFSSGRDMPSHGHLTFAGHNLTHSPLLDDVKVFHLEFSGEQGPAQDREAWADPLRVAVLQRMSSKERAWYLSCTGTYLRTGTPADYVAAVQDLQDNVFDGVEPHHVVVRSEKQHGYGKGFYQRFFFEAPNQILPRVVLRYWPRVVPGWPMEGYNMESARIDLFREWDGMPRDAQLFRAVIDQIFIAFYTYPAEHDHFAFVTNKLSLDDIKQLLAFESLQRLAQEIGEQAMR
jgi:hypothetical protein